jgi:hypothetical protein
MTITIVISAAPRSIHVRRIVIVMIGLLLLLAMRHHPDMTIATTIIGMVETTITTLWKGQTHRLRTNKARSQTSTITAVSGRRRPEVRSHMMPDGWVVPSSSSS